MRGKSDPRDVMQCQKVLEGEAGEASWWNELRGNSLSEYGRRLCQLAFPLLWQTPYHSTVRKEGLVLAQSLRVQSIMVAGT